MSRLEAYVVVPAGWTVAINDGGGADNVTVPAGSYYVTEFLAAFKAAADLATGKTFTVTVSNGRSGTGAITVTINTGTFSMTWTSTDLRDYMGFTGTVSGAATYTAPRGCQAMWIPKCALAGTAMDFASTGHLRTDARYSQSPTGRVLVWVGNARRSFTGVRWSHVNEERAIEGVGTALNSWQRWVRETQWGGLSYFPIVDGEAPPARVYHDADTSALLGATAGGLGVYRLVLPPSLELATPTEGWTGLWTVAITELVKQ